MKTKDRDDFKYILNYVDAETEVTYKFAADVGLWDIHDHIKNFLLACSWTEDQVRGSLLRDEDYDDAHPDRDEDSDGYSYDNDDEEDELSIFGDSDEAYEDEEAEDLNEYDALFRQAEVDEDDGEAKCKGCRCCEDQIDLGGC